MSNSADRTIATLRANHDDLAGRVRELDEAALGRTSGASEWDVAQVLSHLGSGAEIGLASLRAATEGAAAPDDNFNQSVWARWDAMDQIQKRDGFLRAGDEIVRAFEALDAETRRNAEVKLSFLPNPLPLGVFAGMRLSEAAHHSWDVRVTTDPSATLTRDEADLLLDNITGPLNFMIGFTSKPEALAGTQARLRIETTDPERMFGLVLGPAVSLGDPLEDTDGVLRLPAEALARLLVGRLGPEHTPDEVQLNSLVVTLDQLRAVFPGF